MSLTADLKALAQSLGFSAAAVAPAEPLTTAYRQLRQWVKDGRAAEMEWFSLDRAEKATNPGKLLEMARSVVVLAAPYWHGAPIPPGDDEQPRGRISRYAWGRDYHKVLGKHLRTLRGFLDLAEPGSETRVMVDWGPLAEKAFGVRAGLGWYGKNSNLLVPGGGSWLFLADLVTTVALEPDQPLRKTCGNCTRCLPVCPTNAFVSPYVVDANRCISYLTIEHRGPIDRELRPLMGDWVFGCDLCQDACPVNKRSRVRGWSEFRPQTLDDAVPALIPLLSLTEEQFRERFAGRPILRAKRGGLLRNVCIALGNIGDRGALVPLANVLTDRDPLVRGHAAWALGRLGGSYARAALERAVKAEDDRWVREEIELALEAVGSVLQPSAREHYHREVLAWLGAGASAAEIGAPPPPDPLEQKVALEQLLGHVHAKAGAPHKPDPSTEFKREVERFTAHLDTPVVAVEEPAPAADSNDAFRRLLEEP